MTDTLVISGLVKRRAILSGEIMQIKKQLKQKLLDLKTLDAAIKMFDADYPIDTIKPKGLRHSSGDWETRGELMRLILSILRNSTTPMSARDIALEVMTLKQMDTSNYNAVLSMRERVGRALRKKRTIGLLCSRKGEEGLPVLWELSKKAKPLYVASSLSTAC
jgi:hypothetical protein